MNPLAHFDPDDPYPESDGAPYDTYGSRNTMSTTPSTIGWRSGCAKGAACARCPT